MKRDFSADFLTALMDLERLLQPLSKMLNQSLCYILNPFSSGFLGPCFCSLDPKSLNFLNRPLHTVAKKFHW